MTTYKEIKGTNIEAVASDPSNPIDGQIWFNTTVGDVKGNIDYGTGAWSTGGNVNTARDRLAGVGTQTAALAFGGNHPLLALTEKYNGTNWTEVNNLNTARNTLAGAGTQTAALGFGGNDGSVSVDTETWNGTNWTEVNDLLTARIDTTGSGASSSSAIAFGGNPGSTTITQIWGGGVQTIDIG